jgi:hypothetical protein
MKETLKADYETAKSMLGDFMGMVARSVPWPTKGLIGPFTEQFTATLDGLYAEQVCLIEALHRKDIRIRELEAIASAADGWAELEEL